MYRSNYLYYSRLLYDV